MKIYTLENKNEIFVICNRSIFYDKKGLYFYSPFN